MRLNAIRALGEVGAEAVSTLIQALSHESESARYAASTALAKIGSDSVPALVVALGSDDEVLVIGSANTILQMPGHVDEAIPALIRCLERENIYVRIAVVNALGSQGSYAMVAVPHLIPLLGDADPLIKNVALAALMNITWKDFGDDPEIWEQWWDGRQQFDP
jgi:HEAT repeat protein